MKYTPLQLKYEYGLDLVEKYCPPNCGGPPRLPDGRGSALNKDELSQIRESLQKQSKDAGGMEVVEVHQNGKVVAREIGSEDSTDLPKSTPNEGKIQIHHSHPDESSLSQQDYLLFGKRHNIDQVWAHTPVGSFGAVKKTEDADKIFMAIKKFDITPLLDYKMDLFNNGMEREEVKKVAIVLEGHALGHFLQNKGLISYHITHTSADYNRILSDHKSFVNKLIKNWTEQTSRSDKEMAKAIGWTVEPLQATEGEAAVSCQTCVHFDGHYACPAYPNGVPMSLYLGIYKHDKVLGCQDGELTWESKQALEMDIADFLNLIPARRFGSYHGVEAFCPPNCGGKDAATWNDFNDPSQRAGMPSHKQIEQLENGFSKLSRDEQNALDNYAGAGYRRINDKLRFGTGFSSITEEQIIHIDSAMSKSALTEDVVVYRGMKTAHLFPLKEGTEFIDKSYVSTTLKPEKANHFARLQDGPTAIVKIIVPAGTNVAIPAGRLTHNGKLYDEAEILLPRGQRFKFKSFTMKDDGPSLAVVELIK